jgi:hypothetical protein
MTMTKRSEPLPRPRAELEKLAAYYDTHDTAEEMEHGEWVDPRPMKTTSLRLPAPLIDQIKAIAKSEGMDYTSYIRALLQRAVSGQVVVDEQELTRIRERLDRIEKAVRRAS